LKLVFCVSQYQKSIMGDEIGGICSEHGGDENTKFYLGNLK